MNIGLDMCAVQEEVRRGSRALELGYGRRELHVGAEPVSSAGGARAPHTDHSSAVAFSLVILVTFLSLK